MSCCSDPILLGKTGRALKVITVQAASLQTSAYSSGQVLAAQMVFDCAVQETGGSGIISEAVLYEKASGAAVLPTVDLILFNMSQTLASVGSAYVGPSTVTQILGVISFSTGSYKEVSTGRALCSRQSTNLNVVADSSSRTIYGALIAKAGFTLPSGTELHCQIRIIQD